MNCTKHLPILVSGILLAVTNLSGCGPSPATATSMAVPELGSTPTDGLIRKYRAVAEKQPKSVEALVNLGEAQLQKGRESGELAWYVEGRRCLEKAVALDPGDPVALTRLAASKTVFHDFHGAVKLAKEAIQHGATHQAYGVLVDSCLELGDYDAATEAAQKMIDAKPDMGSYSRVSKLRYLMGDIKGAILTMEKALACGSMFSENAAWCRTQIGDLYWRSGAYPAAEKQFLGALEKVPNYRHAQAGLARIRFGQGKRAEAIGLMTRACEGKAAPIPYLAELGDYHIAAGDSDKAEAAFARIGETVKRYHEAGIEGEEIMVAQFQLDHDRNVAEAAKVAASEMSHHQTVEAYANLAWSQYKQAKFAEAKGSMKKAMRTGVQDALLWYRLAKIEAALGNKTEADRLMASAKSLHPNFHPIFAR
ncbi:MAG: Lipopolysaccharide assembly protein B [Fimbriimonadaceae bacterium]|nr:Lipopolysaccharide assembly protein B [Fimbriimonadaceae bacterium]